MKFSIAVAVMAVLALTGFSRALPTPASLDAPSTSGPCSNINNRCVGNLTYWAGGLGACGWNVDTNIHNEIALPWQFMGAQSNGNPYCGQSVTIYNPGNGATATAIVGDKCGGCTDRGIDLTETLFSQLANGHLGLGHVYNVQWWFNN